jgi:group I intron endonuclease
MGYIYLITNFTNGKRYVGQTVNPIHYRWSKHIEEAYGGNKSNSLLHRAIIKYGASNFGINILEECADTELNEKEKNYIKKYDTYYTHNKGYNMTWGGEGVTKYSDDEILYLWNQGYRNCEIARLLGAKDTTISLRIQSLIGSNAAKARRIDSRKISIIQYDLQGNYIKEWESASIAEKELNLSQGSISRCCNK